MPILTELRKLAEAVRDDEDSAWDTEPSVLLEGYTVVTDGGTVTVCHCFREERAAFIAAASPDVVMKLLDEIERLQSTNQKCVDVTAEWGRKAGEALAEAMRMRDAADAARDRLQHCEAERDQLRIALKEICKGGIHDVCLFARDTLSDTDVENL